MLSLTEQNLSHSFIENHPQPSPHTGKENNMNLSKHKTELCRSYTELGRCNYGKRCQFAHGDGELRKKNPPNTKYKTKECSNFRNEGYCHYGSRCLFSHKILIKERAPKNLWSFKSLRKFYSDPVTSSHWKDKANEPFWGWGSKSIKDLILEDIQEEKNKRLETV